MLADVPASAVGSCTGVNVVDVAFADYSGGINGTEAPAEIIKKGVVEVHKKVEAFLLKIYRNKTKRKTYVKRFHAQPQAGL